mgnify:FL=1
MLTVARVAALLLAAVFVVAAVAKFRDQPATRRAMRDIGLPNPRLMAVAVPLVEAASALLLLVDPTTGGPCAVALLAAFTTLIAGRLLAGHEGGCGCFGAWSTRPPSWRDLARNALLMGLGVAAALG